VALLISILTVVAVLVGMSGLLWLSTFVESRKLGQPASVGLGADPGTVSVVGPVGSVSSAGSVGSVGSVAVGEVQPAA
jgi:hypothetical protein